MEYKMHEKTFTPKKASIGVEDGGQGYMEYELPTLATVAEWFETPESIEAQNVYKTFAKYMRDHYYSDKATTDAGTVNDPQADAEKKAAAQNRLDNGYTANWHAPNFGAKKIGNRWKGLGDYVKIAEKRLKAAFPEKVEFSDTEIIEEAKLVKDLIG